jgi:outer membrane receptor protein involved in Fe transport
MDHSAYAVCVRLPGALVRTSGLICFAVLSLSIAALTPSAAHAAEATRAFTGRAVGDVLDGLRSQGLTFIYSTQILPADLRVEHEPLARSGVALAMEILAAHRLSISQAAPGVYAVVPQEAVVRSPADALPSLRARDETLEEVVVHTSRYALIADLAVSGSLLTQEQVQNMPRLADEPLRAAQRLPGVASNGFSSFGPVRGGEPNETAIVLDGLRLYEPFHLKNFLSPVSLLDSRLIQSMEIYSGGFPTPYGDRMSAIIDARSVRPTQPQYYEAGLSLFHASGLASAAFADDRGRGLISARRSNIGDLARYSEHDYGEPQYADGLMRVDYRFDEATRASFDTLMSGDRIKALRDSGRQRADAEYRNTYAWATLEHDWSERFSSRAILSYTDVVNKRHGAINDPGQRVGAVRDERNFHIIGLRVENELSNDAVEHRFGAEVRRVWGGYDYLSDVLFAPGFPLPDSPGARVQQAATPRPDGFETGAYWDGRIELGARWTVQPGLRFDTQTYDGSGDAEQWSPRLNVLYTPGDATRLRASWGRFFQAQASMNCRWKTAWIVFIRRSTPTMSY